MQTTTALFLTLVMVCIVHFYGQVNRADIECRLAYIVFMYLCWMVCFPLNRKAYTHIFYGRGIYVIGVTSLQ